MDAQNETNEREMRFNGMFDGRKQFEKQPTSHAQASAFQPLTG
jgi:hypothetical protein